MILYFWYNFFNRWLNRSGGGGGGGGMCCCFCVSFSDLLSFCAGFFFQFTDAFFGMTNVIHLASILWTFPSCQAIFHQHQPMVSMHLSSFAMPVVAQMIVTFLQRHRALVTRLLSQGYKVNRLSNTFKKCYGRHTDLVGQYKKNVCQMFADSISWNDFYFYFWWICRWSN